MIIIPGRINGKVRIQPVKREHATITPVAVSYTLNSACLKCKGLLEPRAPTQPRRRRGRAYSPQSLQRAFANYQCPSCGARTRR